MSQLKESKTPVTSGDNRNADGTFKSGMSGNQKGRPKGIQQIPDLLRKIGEEDGSVAGYTKLEVVLRRVFQFALEGKSWAVEFIAERTEGRVRQELQVDMMPEVIFTPIDEVTEDEWNDKIIESTQNQLPAPEDVN